METIDYRWRVPGNYNPFNTKLENWKDGIYSQRSIGILEYVQKFETVETKKYKDEIWNYLEVNYGHKKNSSSVSDWYRIFVFMGLMNYEDECLSLSIDGKNFLKEMHEKNFEKALDIFLNAMLKSSYPTPVANDIHLSLFPFRIIFKMLLEGPIQKNWFETKIPYIKNYEDLENLEHIKCFPYTKWGQWVLSFLKEWEIIDIQEGYVKLLNNKKEFFESAIGNMSYENMFFDSEGEIMRDTEEGNDELYEPSSFLDHLNQKNYFFELETIENYLLSLKVKPFVILTGNSGTGKTKLSQEFAKYLKNKKKFYYTRLNVGKSSYGDDKNFEIGTNTDYPLKDYFGQCKIKIYDEEFPIEVSFRPIINYRGNDELVEYLRNKYVSSKYTVMINSLDLSNCIIDDYERPNKILEGNVKISNLLCNKRNLCGCRIKIPVSDLDWKVRDFIPFENGYCRIMIDNNIFCTKFEVFLYFQLDENIRDEIKNLFDRKLGEYGDDTYVPVSIDTTSFTYLNNNDSSSDFSEIGNNINHSDYELIPVGANWTDNRNILGFYNVIAKNYQSTTALDLIINSDKYSNSPFFLILDEMNLSHVERYFSDFLSAIESREDIPLYSPQNVEKKLEIPPRLTIPENLFVIGTVNVDETTYMFSPKVLDRANVLEFETFSEESITIGRFMDCDDRGKEENKTNVQHFSYLEDPLSDLGIINKPMTFFKDEFSNKNKDLWNQFGSNLEKIHSILKKSRFDFGFRVVKEIIAFMYVAAKYEGFFEDDNLNKDNTDWANRYFDAQIKQKILPKIHGSKKVLDDTLDELLAFCIGCELKELDDKLENLKSDKNPKNIDFTKENSKYPTSAKKIAEMRDILEKQRYVSFIN